MKNVLVITLLICFTVGVVGQEGVNDSEVDPIVKTYMRNFVRASLQTKIQILQDAGKLGNVDMGPLYMKALDFVLSNESLLESDPSDTMMKQLAVLAVRLVGIGGYREARYLLWDLFRSSRDTSSRVAVMNALGEIADGDQKIIEALNDWLSRQNSLYQTGNKPDPQVVGECITSLGKLGDPSSFPIIFTSLTLKFSDEITNKAREALYTIEGDFQTLITNVIEKNPIRDKLAALKMALGSGKLTDQQKGQIAEAALQVALRTSSPESSEQAQLREMRYVAVRALTERVWSKATPLAIQHFDIIVVEYDRGIVSKSNFLEAIACLGAMGTREAAERLSLYLGLLNQYKENNKSVDEQVVLAVINNLGRLGDSVAADNLLYAQYLDYSSTVRKAAKEAFNNLKRR